MYKFVVLSCLLGVAFCAKFQSFNSRQSFGSSSAFRPVNTSPTGCVTRPGYFGPCSATCGQATKSRPLIVVHRNDPGGVPCPSPLIETVPCQGLPPCPQLLPRPVIQPAPRPYGPAVDCEVWYDPWTQCSKSCGGGFQERTGIIEVHPKNGGRACPPLQERRPCNTDACQQLINPYPVDCTQRDNGLVADPTAQCSHIYYSCSNGVTREHRCYGRLYFDPENLECETYARVFACSGKRPTVTAAPYTTQAPYTQAPEFDCTTKEDGIYKDPLNKCSHRYFVCSNGYTSEMKCDANMYYDAQNEKCDRYVKVFDCTGQQFIETPAPYTEAPVEPKPVPIDCSTLEDGEHGDPQKDCSERFYACSNKVGFEKFCPGNTYFDKELKVCDTYTRTPACSGRPRQPDNLLPAEQPQYVVLSVTLSDPITLGYGTDEASLKAAVAAAMNMLVSQVTEVTVLSNTQLRITAAYSILAKLTKLSAGYGRLTLLYKGRQVGILKISVEKTITGSKVPRPVYPFECEGREDGNYAANTDASYGARSCANHYWVCNAGVTERMECPGNTKYDAEFDRCEVDEYLPACGGSRPLPTTTTQAAPTLPPVYDCEQKDDGLYPESPNACSQKYYSCANGEAYEFGCPAKTFFDANKQACRSKSKIVACKHQGGYKVPQPRPRPQLPVNRYGRPQPQPQPRVVLARPAVRQFSSSFKSAKAVAPARFQQPTFVNTFNNRHYQ